MILRELNENDLPDLLVIHNHAVLTTTAIWDQSPDDLSGRRLWLQTRRQAGYPVLGCEQAGVLLGFATFGDFRPRWGYRYTVEHSVYVSPEHQRRGAARLLLQALITRAQALGKHAMIGGIEASNTPSLTLHAAMGFEVCGRLPQVGAKFDRWLDLIFMQRLLDQAPTPPSA